jgi:hypothetical protein
MIPVLDPLPLSWIPGKADQQRTSLKDVPAEEPGPYLVVIQDPEGNELCRT